MLNQLVAALLMLLLVSLPVSRTIAQTPEVTPATAPATLNYQVPAVTLLPDSPLYKLQLVWDRLSLLFSVGANNKTTKYITLADRDLTAAAKLIEKDNIPLGVHTAFRGEHYMTLLVNELKAVAYSTGKLDSSIIDRAHSAFPYHQQLVSEMISKTSGEHQASLMAILEFSQRNDGELKNLEQEYTLGQ